MLRSKALWVAAASVLIGAAALTVWAADLTFDNLPLRAKEALAKLAGDNKITEVESEKEHGVQVFEAAWNVDGREVEAEVTADGVLLEMEEIVPASEVPGAVRAAAEQALAGAPKITYEKHTVVFYEVKGKVADKTKEVKISPTGQVAGQEDEEGDDEGEDDDDDASGK